MLYAYVFGPIVITAGYWVDAGSQWYPARGRDPSR